MESDDRNDHEPTVMKWWKLYDRPKADSYTMAGVYAILATIFVFNAHIATPGWRIAFVVIALAVTARFVWKAWRLPPDPPLTH
jgi:hypothetical protein